MANYNKITESKFNAIKMLLKGGATAHEAAEFMKVSSVTVYAIKKAETFADYISYSTAKALERGKQIAQKKAQTVTDDKQPGGTLSANYQLNRLFEQMKAQTELLKLISEKMAFIVEQLA